MSDVPFTHLTDFGSHGIATESQNWGKDINTLWYACEYPERPADPYVMWHITDPCQGCRIAALALLNRHPSDPHVRWLNDALAAPA